MLHIYTVEPLLKDTPNKGHNRFSLSLASARVCNVYVSVCICILAYACKGVHVAMWYNYSVVYRFMCGYLTSSSSSMCSFFNLNKAVKFTKL